MEALADAGGELVDITAKANFRALGKRFGKPACRRSPRRSPPPTPAALARRAPRRRDGDGRASTARRSRSTADEVVVTETPRAGWAVAADAGATVALDLTITPELRRAGLARDAIRLIQEARKSSGLDVTDRIELRWSATSAEVAEALREHGAAVADEVLATSFAEGAVGADGRADEELGLTFALRKD